MSYSFSMMMFGFFLLSVIISFVYLKIADKFDIIDKTQRKKLAYEYYNKRHRYSYSDYSGRCLLCVG